MKESSNFLIAIAAAVITFGTLYLVIGPKRVEWQGHSYYVHGMHHDANNSCCKEDEEK